MRISTLIFASHIFIQINFSPIQFNLLQAPKLKGQPNGHFSSGLRLISISIAANEETNFKYFSKPPRVVLVAYSGCVSVMIRANGISKLNLPCLCWSLEFCRVQSIANQCICPPTRLRSTWVAAAVAVVAAFGLNRPVPSSGADQRLADWPKHIRSLLCNCVQDIEEAKWKFLKC